MRFKEKSQAILILLCLLFFSPLLPADDEPVQIELLSESTSIQPNQPFWVAIKIHLEPSWNLYGKSAGDFGIPPQIHWNLPDGLEIQNEIWPTPERKTEGGGVSFVYRDEVLLLFEMLPSTSLSEGNIGVNMEWLACSNEACVPGESNASLSLPVTAPIAVGEKIETTSGEKSQFFLFVCLAFVGGMILNLMPCVLPVVSLKLLSFTKLAGKCRKTTLQHGCAFSFGVLISFWILAGTLITLQAFGEVVGWGFQLQEPRFVAGLAAFLLVFSLSLFGLFEMGLGLGAKASHLQRRSSGLLASFLGGVMATIMATPCTGPFLGSALGYAVTLPAIGSLTIFTFLGLGMSFPYLLLTAFPQSLKLLPKPGPWMEHFKQGMGFLMLGTVIWLLWVFADQTSNDALFTLVGALLILAVATWAYGKLCSPLSGAKTRKIGFVVTLVLLAIAGWGIIRSLSSSSDDWIAFSPEQLHVFQEEGKTVFIDFTAKWCLTCQTNHLALESEAVKKAMKEKGVIKMKADWTKKDPTITKYLQQYGRTGVPLYLLFTDGASTNPEILPQILTPRDVLRHLEKMD